MSQKVSIDSPFVLDLRLRDVSRHDIWTVCLESLLEEPKDCARTFELSIVQMSRHSSTTHFQNSKVEFQIDPVVGRGARTPLAQHRQPPASSLISTTPLLDDPDAPSAAPSTPTSPVAEPVSNGSVDMCASFKGSHRESRFLIKSKIFGHGRSAYVRAFVGSHPTPLDQNSIRNSPKRCCICVHWAPRPFRSPAPPISRRRSAAAATT